MNIQSLLNLAQNRLQQSATPLLDAELLLCHILQTTRAKLYTWPEQELQTAEADSFLTLLAKREQGQPLAYLLGIKEFWSMPLKVNEATLIPRPETELLVEILLEQLQDKHNAKIVDLGTGSGAIALALAMERPAWSILATDQSPQALAVAEQNCKQYKLNNVEFRLGDWCQALSGETFDAIVSNPPYIKKNAECLLKDGLRFEPKTALIGGEDGLEALRIIIQNAFDHLKPGGLLLLEHAWDQSAEVKMLVKTRGYCNIKSLKDLAGQYRATLCFVS